LGAGLIAAPGQRRVLGVSLKSDTIFASKATERALIAAQQFGRYLAPLQSQGVDE
jgi:hypothetical protein